MQNFKSVGYILLDKEITFEPPPPPPKNPHLCQQLPLVLILYEVCFWSERAQRRRRVIIKG